MRSQLETADKGEAEISSATRAWLSHTADVAHRLSQRNGTRSALRTLSNTDDIAICLKLGEDWRLGRGKEEK